MKRAVFVILFSCMSFAFAQVPDVEELIHKENFVQADKIVRKRIDYFFQTKNVDTLHHYVPLLGTVSEKTRGLTYAKQEVSAFLKQAKNTFPYAKQLVKIHLNAAYFFVAMGDYNFGYHIIADMDTYFLPKRDRIIAELPNVYFALGDLALQMSDLELARVKFLQSIAFLGKVPDPDKLDLTRAYYSMGSIMWNSSKLDSSVYYYNKALAIVKKIENDPYNHYRLATLHNALGMVYDESGKPKQALQFYETAIEDIRNFLSTPEPHPRKENAALDQLRVIYNLGNLYAGIGDLGKAKQIFLYLYEQRLQKLDSNSLDIANSLIALARIYNNQHQYIQAKEYSLKGLRIIKESDNITTSSGADAYTALAEAYYNLNEIEKASLHFEEANKIHKKITQGNFDDNYFNFQSSLSDFYRETNQTDKAINVANRGLNDLLKSNGENNIRSLKMLKTLITAEYKKGHYLLVKQNATKGLNIANHLLAKSFDSLDSMKIEQEIPELILYKTRASYQLLQKKDIIQISTLCAELDKTLRIFEKRKSILSDEKDLQSLLLTHKDLTDFIKQLTYELYKLSGDKKYMDDVVSTHENSVYTRIRSRMDKQNAIRFARVPENIQQEEARIKEQLQTAFNGNGTPDKKISSYMNAMAQWNSFQKKLKTKYPDYYNMRYGSIDISVEEWRKNIPRDITVIRYLFAEEELYALIATKHKQTFISLSAKDITEKITALNTNTDRATALAYDLYQQLWQPLEKEVSTKRVIIIPDGILYNLSFDMLTPIHTYNYTELSRKCLLHKFAISYHYSMLALHHDKEPAKMKGNFVAFAPGFSEETKQQYLSLAQDDSLHLDRAYLSLLPLPFTTKLVNGIKDKFGGTIFSDSRSTPGTFRQASAYNRIIHIGTHAEANNDHPEYSRLIFAKDSRDPTAENSVYLYDIYNLDLTSDLSVLTACESGKPGYQDGEGMISMAHAFSYAGSRSIMTGLWKLDEQATAMITEYFYMNINKGLPKDEALQQAKLQYLQQANGRMLDPTYWAGLAMMGDLEPITLEHSYSSWYYLIGAMVLLLVSCCAWLLLKRKN